MNKLCHNIKRRRKELGLSQRDLAQKLGFTSHTSISKVESGVYEISASQIEEFANALETTPTALTGWVEDSASAFGKALFAAHSDLSPEDYTEEDIEDVAVFLKIKRKRPTKDGE